MEPGLGAIHVSIETKAVSLKEEVNSSDIKFIAPFSHIPLIAKPHSWAISAYDVNKQKLYVLLI
jgi:hypothetical protein